MAGSTFLEDEISAVQDRCVFRRSLDRVWIKPCMAKWLLGAVNFETLVQETELWASMST